MTLPELFSEYVKAGLYLKGWSPKTPVIYERAFRSLQASLGEESLTKGRLEAWVVAMRERGLTPACVNIYVRAMNAFIHWLHAEGHVDVRVILRQLPNPQKPLRGISDVEVRAILAFRPVVKQAVRTWTLITLLLDTGVRIDEALGLTVANVDMDGLSIRVLGKGNRERLVPFSFELRKHLFRYSRSEVRADISSPFVFCSGDGSQLMYRNAYRDIKNLCAKAGVTGEHVHPHSFRHKFATTYIRRGGDIYRLSRILGHSTISTTQVYLRSMGIEHLGERHSALSPLSRHG